MRKVYRTGYAFSTADLFTKWKKKLKFDKKVAEKNNCPTSSFYTAVSVFNRAVQLVLLDVIEKNDSFLLPVKNESYIEMYKLSKDELKLARQNGAFPELDLLRSGFSMSRIVFRYKNKSRWFKKPIYVHEKLKKLILDRVYKRFY